MDYALFLQEQLPVVKGVVRAVASSLRLSHQDRADLCGEALLHLMADDYRVLRAFEGRSSLNTYLSVVLRRLWQDRCARRWNRWRPSAEARRLGPLAVHLERLVQRDGLSLAEAISAMQMTGGADAVRLCAIWRRLPHRTRRQMVNVDALTDVAHAGLTVAPAFWRRTDNGHVAGALRAVLGTLPVEDRRLLRLRFIDGVSMADISRTLGIRQKQVYPRFVRLLRLLRQSLEARGVHAADVDTLAGMNAMSGS